MPASRTRPTGAKGRTNRPVGSGARECRCYVVWTAAKRRSRAGRRFQLAAGFTLVEILLVLALLVVATGLVWPAVWGMVRDVRLRQGAEDVRMSLAATRLHALESGEAYRWFCQPGGRWYLALPFEPVLPTTSSGSNTGNAAGATPAKTPWRSLRELPEGVVFDATTTGAGGVTQAIPPELLAGLPGAEKLNELVVWAELVTYQPDGSCRGALLKVVDARGLVVSLEVKPLTGGITMGTVEVQRAP